VTVTFRHSFCIEQPLKKTTEKVMGRRREERIEIHERLIVRTASGSFPALCEACSAGDGILLSPEQASAVTGIAIRLIYRWVEAGTIHYRETANGKLSVCVKTLLAAAQGDQQL
jgi:hypothetical protein